MIFQASFYKSKKLLLIEDCEPVRASIKGMLQQTGFEDITTAPDALQALALVKKQGFDFILADFDLGAGQDALQFFAELQQQALLKVGCCFLLMSAEPRRLPVLGALQGAPDAFILKPFSYLELEKRLAKAWNQRAKLRKVYQALQDSDYPTAQLELDQVINARNSASLTALRLMGEVLLREGNFAAAQKLYEQVLQQRDFSWARLGQAVSVLQQQDYSVAEAMLQPQLELDDIRPEALQWLACLHLLQAQFSQARQYLSELLRAQPTHIEAHLASASLCLLGGNLDEAIKYWQKLIQQYRFSGFDRAEFYLELSRLLLLQAQQGGLTDISPKLKKALDALSSMPNKLQQDKTQAAVALLRGRISVLQGNFADAKQQLALMPAVAELADPASLYDGASLAFAMGELTLCEQYLTAVSQNMPACNSLESCRQQVVAAYLQQQEQQLRSQIRQWSQAGMALLQQGKPVQAMAPFAQAFVYMPCNAALVLNMLQVLTELPAEKKWQTVAKMALSALEFSNKTSANQQRLAELLAKLPELYLN